MSMVVVMMCLVKGLVSVEFLMRGMNELGGMMPRLGCC